MSTYSQPDIQSELVNTFSLPDDISDLLYKHYLLFWSGDYFQDLYYKRGAMITHQESKYLVLWDNHDIRPIMAATRVALSFRKLHSIDPHGYVIVKAIEFPAKKSTR